MSASPAANLAADYDQTKEVDIRHDMEKKLHMK